MSDRVCMTYIITFNFNLMYSVIDRRSCVQQAKTNMETLYLAVGISENIPAYLQVMETLLPQFFSWCSTEIC